MRTATSSLRISFCVVIVFISFVGIELLWLFQPLLNGALIVLLAKLLTHRVRFILQRTFNAASKRDLLLLVRIGFAACGSLFLQWGACTGLHHQPHVTFLINPRSQLNLEITEVFIIVACIGTLDVEPDLLIIGFQHTEDDVWESCKLTRSAQHVLRGNRS